MVLAILAQDLLNFYQSPTTKEGLAKRTTLKDVLHAWDRIRLVGELEKKCLEKKLLEPAYHAYEAYLNDHGVPKNIITCKKCLQHMTPTPASDLARELNL